MKLSKSNLKEKKKRKRREDWPSRDDRKQNKNGDTENKIGKNENDCKK